MLEADEIEGLALDIYRATKRDACDPPGALALARDLLGPDAVETGRAPANAMLTKDLWGAWRIMLRPGQRRTRREFAIAHELIEYWLARQGYVGEDVERVATFGAACLIVPRPAFRRAWPFHGWDGLRPLARLFRTSQTCVTLRAGEIYDVPLAVVCKSGWVFRRWIDAAITDAELRRLAIGRPSTFDAPKVMRVRDASERFAMVFPGE